MNTVTGFTNIGGLPMGTAYANLTAISNTAYSAGCGTGTGCSDKVMQVMWTGARYAVDRNLDVAVAYYHYIQNQYVSGAGICTNPTAHSQCAGTFDAVFRPGRLAVSAEVGCLFWYDVLAGERGTIEWLPRPQQLRSDRGRSLPLLSIAAGSIDE